MTYQSNLPQPRYDHVDEITPILKQIANGDTQSALESIDQLANKSIPLQNSVGRSPDEGFHDPTLLMIASSYGDMEIVKNLLARGCDPRVCNRDGIDAYTFAASKGNLDVLNRLESAGVTHTNAKMIGTLAAPIFWAARYGQMEVVQKLEILGADIHGVTEDGITLLHNASEAANPKLVEWLLDRGLDINGQGLRDAHAFKLRTMTPLMEAARGLTLAPNADHVATVQLLIKRGADVMKTDSFGRTALSWATDKAIKALLIETGCPPESDKENGIWALASFASDLSFRFPNSPHLKSLENLTSDLLRESQNGEQLGDENEGL